MHIRPRFALKPRAPRLSFRQRILVYSFAAFIPFLAFSYVSIQQNVANARQQRLQNASSTAAIAAVTVDELIAGTQRFLASLADLPDVRSGKVAAANQVFAHNLLHYPAYTEIFAANAKGEVYANAFRGIGEPLEVSDRPYFAQLMQSCTPVVSDRIIGNISLQPNVVIASPIRDDNSTCVGLMGAVVSLAELQQQLTRGSDHRDSAIIVVDSNGTALIHSDYELMQGRQGFAFLDPATVPSTTDIGETKVRNPVDGSDWLSVYTPLGRAPWTVLVAYPAAAISTLNNNILIGGLLTLLMVLSAAVGIELFFSDRIAQSLRRVSGQAAKLTNSFYGVDVNTELDEVQQVRLALDYLQSNLLKNSENLAAMRLEIADHRQRLQDALVDAQELQEYERKRIAFEVHDGVVQFLVDALYKARVSELKLPEDREASLDGLRTVQGLLEETIAEMHRVIYDLWPPNLAGLGLDGAIGGYLEGFREISGLACHVVLRGNPARLSPTTELGVYRVAQEALRNVRKHARAANITVELEFGDVAFQLVVADDGGGFDLGHHESGNGGSRNHIGLYSMRDRARRIGGTLHIESGQGQGTRVVLRVPITPTVEAAGAMGVHVDALRTSA